MFVCTKIRSRRVYPLLGRASANHTLFNPRSQSSLIGHFSICFLPLFLLLSLTGCAGSFNGIGAGRHNVPLKSSTLVDLKRRGLSAADPILIRIFKKDNILEVWKRRRGSIRYVKFRDYRICAWSGKIGPKFFEGDKQSPEGFYRVGFQQLNPRSSYHLAFNIGFPNAFDQAWNRTGTHLMVHGSCSSAGCYAMEDEQVEEIYALAREALKGGQKHFQVQAFPFRLTSENLKRYTDHQHYPFWLMLKVGYDMFETTRIEPTVNVCGRRYVFNALPANGDRYLNATRKCPPLRTASYFTNAMRDQYREIHALWKLYRPARDRYQVRLPRTIKRHQMSLPPSARPASGFSRRLH